MKCECSNSRLFCLSAFWPKWLGKNKFRIWPWYVESKTKTFCRLILVKENFEIGKIIFAYCNSIFSAGHFQKITISKFTSDGSHFVTAGKDGNVLLWSLDTVINSEKCKPRNVWNHHSLGITDMHLGFGGLKSRIFTCSEDQTVKIYCVGSGHYLLNIEFPSPLNSIGTLATL